MTDTTLTLMQITGCAALGGAALLLTGLIVGVLMGWRMARVSQ